jgi:uncharacterized protein (TIGR02246 family)
MSALAPTKTDTPDARSQSKELTMLPNKPEDWPRLFVHHLNSGDLQALAAVYAPSARFLARCGARIVGSDQIRVMLTRMIQSKTKLQSQVIRAISADDVAMLHSDFEGTAMDPPEKAIDVRYNAIEVLRRESDGCWKLIIGDPNGRE